MFKILLILLALNTHVWAEQLPSEDDIATVQGKAKYARYLYYLVNGADGEYTLQLGDGDYLGTLNNVFGANGIGGILFENGYKSCEDIPTSGSASGDISVGSSSETLTLNFSAASKTVPAGYPESAGEQMDTRVTTNGNSVDVVAEFKCSDSSNIDTGYLLMDYTSFGVKMEGYFQKNSTTGATNVDIYIKTTSGSNQTILIPTQFKTADGTNYTIFSGFLNTTTGRATVTAVQGTVNGNAQIAYLDSTDTTGAPVTTAPNDYGNLTTAGGTTVDTACVEMSSHSTSSDCDAIPAPDTLTINGTANDWTLTNLRNITLSDVN